MKLRFSYDFGFGCERRENFNWKSSTDPKQSLYKIEKHVWRYCRRDGCHRFIKHDKACLSYLKLSKVDEYSSVRKEGAGEIKSFSLLPILDFVKSSESAAVMVKYKKNLKQSHACLHFQSGFVFSSIAQWKKVFPPTVCSCRHIRVYVSFIRK